MIESPLIKELLAENTQDNILEVLQGRLGDVSSEVTKLLRRVTKEKKLRELIRYSGRPDLEAFRQRLLS